MRAVASVLALCWCALAAAPLARAFPPDDGPCCRNGVCCHRPSPSDRECIRTACTCNGHDATGSAGPTLRLDALPPRPPVFSAPALASCRVAIARAAVSSPSLDPLERPPRVSDRHVLV